MTAAMLSDEAALPSWASLAGRLPTAPEARDARWALFDSFDPNDNGHLSLAEVDRGLLLTLVRNAEDEVVLRRCRPAIMRAFQAAKDGSGAGGMSADYVERREFRLLLLYLQRYLELLAMFDAVDANADRRVSEEEFVGALPQLARWGVSVADPRAEFARICDSGGGQVLFDDFSHWALSAGLEGLREGGVHRQGLQPSLSAPVLSPSAALTGRRRF